LIEQGREGGLVGERETRSIYALLQYPLCSLMPNQRKIETFLSSMADGNWVSLRPKRVNETLEKP